MEQVKISRNKNRKTRYKQAAIIRTFSFFSLLVLVVGVQCWSESTPDTETIESLANVSSHQYNNNNKQQFFSQQGRQGRVLLQVYTTESHVTANMTRPVATNATHSSHSSHAHDSNITSRASEFPRIIFSPEQLTNGALVLFVLGDIYMFFALALVCDEFFVPAVDIIAARFQLSEDVAGATFLAVAGSAPELFTSFIGVFIAQSDIGIGTIVGSSVFNVAFVHSICGLISPMPIVLSWWATLRDVIFYSLSLSCLIIFYLDHYVEWWEALILHACYVSFVTFMKFNKRLEAWVKTHIVSKFSHTFSHAIACCDQLEMDDMSTGGANLHVNGHHRGDSRAKSRRRASCYPPRQGLMMLVMQTVQPMTADDRGQGDAERVSDRHRGEQSTSTFMSTDSVNAEPLRSTLYTFRLRRSGSISITHSPRAPRSRDLQLTSSLPLDSEAHQADTQGNNVSSCSTATALEQQSSESHSQRVLKPIECVQDSAVLRSVDECAGGSASGTREIRLTTGKESVITDTPATNRATVADTPTTNRATVADTPTTNRATVTDTPATNRATIADTPTTNRATVADTPTTNRATVEDSSATCTKIDEQCSSRNSTPVSIIEDFSDGLQLKTLPKSVTVKSASCSAFSADGAHVLANDCIIQVPVENRHIRVENVTLSSSGIENETTAPLATTGNTGVTSTSTTTGNTGVTSTSPSNGTGSAGISDTIDPIETTTGTNDDQSFAQLQSRLVSKTDSEEEEAENAPYVSLWTWPDSWRKRIYFLILAPLLLPIWITVPDVRHPKREKFYPWTFVGSVIWIGFFSYLMNWWTYVIGSTLRIPQVEMGLIFLAAGTSIPDIITSVIVVRRGLGDMAIAGSFGSNIFDITVALPLPWLVYGIIFRKSYPVNNEGLLCSIIILFIVLIGSVMMTAAFRWRLTKAMGWCMLALYVVFLAVSLSIDHGLVKNICPVRKAH